MFVPLQNANQYSPTTYKGLVNGFIFSGFRDQYGGDVLFTYWTGLAAYIATPYPPIGTGAAMAVGNVTPNDPSGLLVQFGVSDLNTVPPGTWKLVLVGMAPGEADLQIIAQYPLQVVTALA